MTRIGPGGLGGPNNVNKASFGAKSEATGFGGGSVLGAGGTGDVASFSASAKLGTSGPAVDYKAISNMSLAEAKKQLNPTTFAGLQTLANLG
jgi:hypothetical protein